MATIFVNRTQIREVVKYLIAISCEQPACYGWYDDGTALWSQNYQ